MQKITEKFRREVGTSKNHIEYINMFKAYRYRIKPDPEQIQLLESSFGCARFIYNHFLELKISLYASGKQKLTKYDMDAKLKALKEEHPWLKEVNSQSLQAVTMNLDSAFGRFFKEKKGFPSSSLTQTR